MFLSKSTLLLALPLALAGSTINGTQEADELYGTEYDDVLNGHGGTDQLRAGPGDDILNGGPEYDFLLGEEGNDVMHGGAGPDIVRGLSGNDIHNGGSGNDSLELNEELAIQVIPADCPAVDALDRANGGGGDDVIQWASGHGYVPNFPFGFCVTAGSALADGGGGYDAILVGQNDVKALAEDYVIEEGTQPGYPLRLRSVDTHATLHFRNVEVIVFFDDIVELD